MRFYAARFYRTEPVPLGGKPLTSRATPTAVDGTARPTSMPSCRCRQDPQTYLPAWKDPHGASPTPLGRSKRDLSQAGRCAVGW